VKYWKTALAILAALSASLALADDFKTINGKEYKNVKVSRIEPDGIVIKFSGGIVKLPFTELPSDIQKKYSYDPTAAARYAAQENQKQAALAEQRKADLTRAQEARQSAPKPTRSSASDERPLEDSGLIYGTVIQVIDEGLLVTVRANLFGPERIPEGAIVLLKGKKVAGFYDGDKIKALGAFDGSFDYVTATGFKKTARAFRNSAVHKLDEFPSDVDDPIYRK
jgi:hypothetical protein